MLLGVDIGNTNVKLGLFRGRELAALWRLATDPHRTADELGVVLLSILAQRGYAPSDLEGVVLCSVVPALTGAMEEVCRTYLRVQHLTVRAETRTGLRLCVDSPQEVGADRIVNAAAAHHLYGGPAIVVGLGTATTFDGVTAEGDFLGGAIAPGVEMGAEGLAARTAKLPRIELSFPRTAVGRNTVHAMQAGVLYGHVALVEGMVTRVRAELGGAARVVATGGLARLIAPQTRVFDHVEPDLTLHGLRIIHELNPPPG